MERSIRFNVISWYICIIMTSIHPTVTLSTCVPRPTVTPPRFMGFTNEKVNQGQSSLFNCSVAAFPTPRDDEVRLLGPPGKTATLIQSNVRDGYTRTSLFLVSSHRRGCDVTHACTCSIRYSRETSYMQAVVDFLFKQIFMCGHLSG